MNVGRDSMAMSRRVAAVSLLRLVGVLVLVGCSSRSVVPGAPTPDLTFPDGVPSHALSENVWVNSVERAQVAHAAAINAADFSDPELSQLWSAGRVRSMVVSSQGDLLRGSVSVWLGPRPFEALEVVEASDGRSAEVIGCAAEPDIVSNIPRPTSDGRAAPFTYLLELSPDGHRQIVGAGRPSEPAELSDGRQVTEDYCSTVEVRKGVFSPVPDLESLAGKDIDDVVPPAAPGAPVRP